MPNPSAIGVPNLRFSEEQMTILHMMMNEKECDYSTIDEIVQVNVLSDFSDEEIKTAVNELTKRGFLFEIEKPYGCVYGINKLRIANNETLTH